MRIFTTEGIQGKTEVAAASVARGKLGACPQLTCRSLYRRRDLSAVTCIRPLPRGRGHAAAGAVWRERLERTAPPPPDMMLQALDPEFVCHRSLWSAFGHWPRPRGPQPIVTLATPASTLAIEKGPLTKKRLSSMA